MMFNFTVRNLLIERPADVPADAIIFNAPRPLYGTTTWQGDFCSGIFYAAVNADDPYRMEWIKENQKLDARVLAYVPESEARQKVAGYYKNLGYDVTPEQMDEYWRDSFWQHFGETDLVVE
jgi:hypothetical protein